MFHLSSLTRSAMVFFIQVSMASKSSDGYPSSSGMVGKCVDVLHWIWPCWSKRNNFLLVLPMSKIACTLVEFILLFGLGGQVKFVKYEHIATAFDLVYKPLAIVFCPLSVISFSL